MTNDEERIPVHATEEELIELYEHTHYAKYPDLFSILIIISVVVFIKHFHNQHVNRGFDPAPDELY